LLAHRNFRYEASPVADLGGFMVRCAGKMDQDAMRVISGGLGLLGEDFMVGMRRRARSMVAR